jgi:hypothetical protein
MNDRYNNPNNFANKLKTMLVMHGLFEDQAEKVINNYRTSDAGSAMNGRWDDDISGYPDVTLNVLWFGTKRFALEFLEKECPDHWAKELLK